MIRAIKQGINENGLRVTVKAFMYNHKNYRKELRHRRKMAKWRANHNFSNSIIIGWGGKL